MKSQTAQSARRTPRHDMRAILGDFLTSFVPRRAQGFWIYLDRYSDIWKSGVHEPMHTRIVRTSLGAGMQAVDVGANIGYFTLLMRKAVGRTGHIYAFEPDPRNLGKIRKSVKLNGFGGNVTLEQDAVADTSGRLRFRFQTDSPGTNHIDKDGAEEVRVVSLDDYFRGRDSTCIDFVKIDTEGADPLVFKGMRNLIRSNPHLKLTTEFWPDGMRRLGLDAGDYVRMLKDESFRIFTIDDRMGTFTSALPDEEKGIVTLFCERDS
ncbi:MAG: FkbM family methyltransferase [Thaumarchaeota archaeon]|nr:FkbM family methyltransferase [Nitrososphaerota archaeon]